MNHGSSRSNPATGSCHRAFFKDGDDSWQPGYVGFVPVGTHLVAWSMMTFHLHFQCFCCFRSFEMSGWKSKELWNAQAKCSAEVSSKRLTGSHQLNGSMLRQGKAGSKNQDMIMIYYDQSLSIIINRCIVCVSVRTGTVKFFNPNKALAFACSFSAESLYSIWITFIMVQPCSIHVLLLSFSSFQMVAILPMVFRQM